MRHIAAELDHADGGGFQVSRLTDENGNDVTWLVDRGSRFPDIAQLERHLAGELAAAVTVAEA